MKFGPFAIPKSFDEVWSLVRNIATGLTKLSFEDNFDSFETQMTIPAASEVAARNELRGGAIPVRYLITEHVGAGMVVKGNTAWTRDFVYMQNVSAGSSATVRVRFFKSV